MTILRQPLWMLGAVLALGVVLLTSRHANLSPVAVDFPDETPRADVVRALENLPLYFVENRGQSGGRASYYIAAKDKTIFFTPQGVSFVLNAPRAAATDAAKHPPRWTVALDFLDANPTVPVGLNKTSAVISHFRGPREEWSAGAATFGSLRYADLWSGIDLDYAGAHSSLKYTFQVAAGADPDNIRFAYRGAESIQLSNAGGLVISTPVGTFDDSAPLAWQIIDSRQVDVPVRFILEPGQDSTVVRFALGNYDPAHALVLDPAVLVYAGFIGGANAEGGISGPQHGIAVDSAGNAYVVGTTTSAETTFPAGVGPDLTYNNQSDVFVAKINSTGTALLYAGYIGGASDNHGYAIAVDSTGAAYVTGFTNGGFGFPQVVGPDLTNAGGGDAFVAKINPSGTALDYCGYIGGSGAELGYGIAVDSTGAAYVTGYTASNQLTFPVTVGPDLTYNGGAHDVFVAKVNPVGSGFVYLGYLGGSGDDIGRAIALDGANAAYVTGSTGPAIDVPFPVTAGSLDITYNGGTTDAFVAKISAAGTSLDYSGYLGGSGVDSGNGIAVDGTGAAYVIGDTTSNETTFPSTAGSLDTTFNGIAGSVDAFLAKVNPAGAALVYASYIGGSLDDFGYGIAVDSSGAAYVTGSTVSGEATFPVVEGPDLSFNGGTDAFVAKINSLGSARVYAGYIGGNNTDVGWGIAVNSVGDAFVVGRTHSDETTFPTTAGPDLTYNGLGDDFVAKISFVAAPTPDINVVPTVIDYGAVAVGVSSTQTIIVNNAGTALLTLGALSTPAAPFARIGGTCVNGQTLAPGASCTIDIQFIPVAAGAVASSFNIPSDDPDAGSANGQNTVLVNLSGTGQVVAADLMLDISTTPSPAVLGSPLTYTLTVTNLGPSNASSVKLTDSLPGSAGFVSSTPSQGGCSGIAVVTCALGNLAVGASATVAIVVTPGASSTLSNSASVSSAETDPNPSNNAPTASAPVGASANLSVAVTSVPFPAIVGAPLTYTVTVTNNGPQAASSVTLTTSAPAGADLISAMSSPGTCFGDAPVNCAVGTLSNDVLVSGASAVMTLVVTPVAAGMLNHSVTVAALESDPDPANNSATTTVVSVDSPRERVAAATLGSELLIVPMLVFWLRRRRSNIYL